MSKPDLLLLDEPFSNIDQNLKEDLQPKIKKLLKDINLTTIIVTHDSYEAFYMADKCGIILDQSLKQYDKPYNIHHEPNSIEVAKFFALVKPKKEPPLYLVSKLPVLSNKINLTCAFGELGFKLFSFVQL